MEDEEAIELDSLAAAHEFPSTKDHHVVYNDRNGRLFHGRHGRNTRLEIKVLGVVAHDRRVDPVEKWP